MPKFKFLHGEKDIKKEVENIVAMFLLSLYSGSIRTSNGRSYAINGDYDKAIADLTNAIRSSSRKEVYFRARGDIYAEKGDYDKAIADYTEVIRLYPDDRDALEGRRAAYEALGQQDKAAADRDAVARLEQKFEQDHPELSVFLKYALPGKIDIFKYLSRDIGKTTSETGEQPEKLAAVHLKKSLLSFLEDDELNGAGFLAKALNIYSGMDQAEARRLKSEFLSDFIGGVFGVLNSFDKAIAGWTGLIEKRLENPGELLNNRGNIYTEKAHHYKIIAGWIKAMGAEPEAGACFQTYTSDYDLAIADYTEGIRLAYKDPECNNYFYNRGIVYDEKGEYEKAIADYTEAIRLMPAECPRSEYFYNRGIVYDEKGEYEKAIADYTSAIHLDKSEPNIKALHNRCFAYKAIGQREKAETDFAELNSWFPEYGEVTYRCGKTGSAVVRL